MKTKHIATWIAITLLTAGTVLAQGGPGRSGYGTPPKSDEERAARQVERQQTNRTSRANRCNRAGQGQGNCDGTGQGRGQGNGPRDGSGPRGGTANCPAGT